MFIFVTKQTKPSIDVEFFTPMIIGKLDPDYVEYFKKTYVDTEKFLHAYSEISSSRLELTVTVIWEDESKAEEFKNDPVVIEKFIKVKDEYLLKNNIKFELISKDTV